MNYKKIYKNLIEKVRSEKRTKNDSTYFEKHHIIPDFMFLKRKRKGPTGHLIGDPSHKDNIILLTPREHFISHVLLYKIFKGTRYEFSCGSSLSFFFTKLGHLRANWFGNSKKYDIWRSKGLEAISNSRKGKMPVKDSKTGVMIGSVNIDDPKVLSGEWVHHSKGRYVSEDERKCMSARASGSLNSNYKLITENIRNIIFDCISVSIVDDNHFIANKFISELKSRNIFKKVSSVFIKNNFGSYEKLISEYNEIYNCNIVYDRFYRSMEQREKARQYNINKAKYDKDNKKDS